MLRELVCYTIGTNASLAGTKRPDNLSKLFTRISKIAVRNIFGQFVQNHHLQLFTRNSYLLLRIAGVDNDQFVSL